MKVNTNLLLVEQSLSTLIRKRNKHQTFNHRHTFHFLFLHSDPSSYSDWGPRSICHGFAHLQKYTGKLLRYIITRKLGFTF